MYQTFPMWTCFATLDNESRRLLPEGPVALQHPMSRNAGNNPGHKPMGASCHRSQ